MGEIEQLKDMIRDLNSIIHNQVVGMQAALIDAEHNGPEHGLRWISNGLAGPGHLPDPDDQWYGDANDYYNAHCAEPLGPCEVCGRPSGACGQLHVACTPEHLKQAEAQQNSEPERR